MSESNKVDPFRYSYVSSTIPAQNTEIVKGDTKEETDTYNEQDIPALLNGIRDARKKLLIEEGRVIEKGLSSDDPDILMKATKHWEDVQRRQSGGGHDIKSITFNPHDFGESLGYKTKASGMSFNLMRKMAETPLVRAVISTRQTQVSAFSYPQANKFETGFVIQKKKKFFSQEEEELTDEDRAEMDRIARFLLNGGNDENSWSGDTFDTFLKKLVEDSLTLDQATFEVARNNFGDPVEFAATDGATFRIAATFESDNVAARVAMKEIRGYKPKYVQIIDGEPVNDYYPWELCMGIRNASTDIRMNGYGKSELETLVQIVTWMLYSDTYNGKFFSQGAAPKGFLKVAGNVNSTRLQEFRQQWQSMVTGVMNAWKVPIIESDKMEWIDLQHSNTDMQFAQWQEYLLKVVCSVYKISPEELGFNVGNSGGGNSLFESNNEHKLKYSKDKGLKPLLKSLEFWINKWIVNPLNSEFEIKFVGLDAEDETKALENDIKRAGTFMGLKEVRKKNNLPEELDPDDMILNPVWMQNQTMKQMAGDQQESTEAAEQSGGGVWDNIDLDDNDIEFSSEDMNDTEKALYHEDPFKYELNSFVKSIMDD